MNATSIHDPATGAVTNPYAIVVIPAIGRVLDAIRALADELGQRTFQVSNRTLARRAGLRSASPLPEILRQLDADGQLTYDPASSIVMLPEGPITTVIDHRADRLDENTASQCAPDAPPDHSNDRVKTACMVVGLSIQEEEEAAPPRETGERPVIRLLKRDRARPAVIERILDAIPDLTPERYEAEKAWLRRLKPGKGIGYLFGVLMYGSTLAPVAVGSEGGEGSDALRRERSTARSAGSAGAAAAARARTPGRRSAAGGDGAGSAERAPVRKFTASW
jgi:hypothetical protein